MKTSTRVLFGGAFVASVFLNVVWGTGHTLSEPFSYSNPFAHETTTKVAVTSVNYHKTVQYTVPRAAAKVNTSVDKKHRLVKKAKQAHKAYVPHKKGISTPAPGKIHAKSVIADKRKSQRTPTSAKKPIALHTKKIASATFDCTVIPSIAYQYPPSTVLSAAAKYLPKRSLLKLQYCLERGESG